MKFSYTSFTSRVLGLGGVFVALFSVPLFAHAYVYNIYGLIDALYNLVRMLVPIVATLALVVFFWGLGRYMLKAGDEDARVEGRRLMFWGAIAIFVLFSIWGLIGFIASDLLGPGGVYPISFTL